jgi:hypothetical protein
MGSNHEKLALLKEARLRKCRTDFLTYRKTINLTAKWGWWQIEIAKELQQFYEDLMAGKRPKLVIQAPPQHGKSVQIIDFISWIAGRDPSRRTIYTSFSERLGIRANLRLQRLYDSELYQEIFPETTINRSNAVTLSGQYLRNREILEYVGKEGYFRNTTVRGSITGESLDLGVIDDPIRGRQDANSLTIRDAAWDWFTDDFFTRFSEEAGLLAILTRWHVDDPIGRLIDRYPEVKVLSYPAIAEVNEPHRKQGEALFPEHKSIEFLREREAIMDRANWMALYQQRPMASMDSTLFLTESLLVDGQPVEYPERCDQVFAVLDTALKDGLEHDGTAVIYCARNKIAGHPLIILDWDLIQIQAVFLDEWLPTVNQRLEHFADLTKARQGNVGMWIEDKASGIVLLQQAARRGLPAFPIDNELVRQGKEGRALSVSGHVYAGKVKFSRHAYDKVSRYKGQTRNHLLQQVCGFQLGEKTPHQMDLLDTFTYGVAISLGDSEGW